MLLPSGCTHSKAWDLGPAPVPAVLAIGFSVAWPSDLLVPFLPVPATYFLLKALGQWVATWHRARAVI